MARMPSKEHIRKEADAEGESYEHERAEYEEGTRKKRKRGGSTEGEKSRRRLDRSGRKRYQGGGLVANAQPMQSYGMPPSGRTMSNFFQRPSVPMGTFNPNASAAPAGVPQLSAADAQRMAAAYSAPRGAIPDWARSGGQPPAPAGGYPSGAMAPPAMPSYAQLLQMRDAYNAQEQAQGGNIPAWARSGGPAPTPAGGYPPGAMAPPQMPGYAQLMQMRDAYNAQPFAPNPGAMMARNNVTPTQAGAMSGGQAYSMPQARGFKRGGRTIQER